VQITDVRPGRHKMTVSLRNPNHSAAGAEKTITVTVGGDAGQPSSPAPSSRTSDGGYGY